VVEYRSRIDSNDVRSHSQVKELQNAPEGEWSSGLGLLFREQTVGDSNSPSPIRGQYQKTK
jgi:hypothetical protein